MEIHCKFYFPQLSVFQLWIEFIFANHCCSNQKQSNYIKELFHTKIFCLCKFMNFHRNTSQSFTENMQQSLILRICPDVSNLILRVPA